ncbi:MAG: hypothetical protein K5899_12130 [Bacteroidaceae bacterium]|nr:hypothetical protein [Bacteroidaceae bacterium]
MSLNVKHIYSSTIKTLLMVSSMSLLMTACSEDSSDMQEDRDVLQIIPFTRPFTDEGQLQTRADVPYDNITLPEDYLIFRNLYPQASSEYASIHAYFIENGTTTVNTEGNFVYDYTKEELDTDNFITNTGWSSNVRLRAGKEYYVYGFMPASLTPSASISSNNGSYENKAIININGVDAVTPADICVVTGVKGFDTPITETTDGSVELGNFSYTGKEKDKNYIYLLLDHLFACINIEYTVDAEYSKWRKIILRKVTIAPSDNTPKRNLTVTINGGSYEVSDTEVTGSISGSANVYNEPNATGYIPVEVTEVTPLSVPGYFTPILNSAFKITSTYDVYDTENNLVRTGCTAENKLQLNVTDPARGNCYTVKFVITPTYLYQLSEPDLDNPMIHVGS